MNGAQGIPPSLTARFEPRGLLGAGGMGAVHLAHDRELDRLVAVKTVLPGLSASVRTRFLREAEALARLRHPHVVEVYSYGISDDIPYLVMEYLDATSLDRAEGVDVQDVMLQVAGALEEVHRHGLLHRDVKPGNVLVDSKGRAVLADFGLVHDPDRTALTQTGVLMGTVAYLAPEIYRGEPAGPAADFYAWGVTLHVLEEGQLPFSPQEVLAAGTNGRRPDFGFQVLDPEGPVAATITACLADAPGERPGSRAALQALLRGDETTLEGVRIPGEASGGHPPQASSSAEIPVAPRKTPKRLLPGLLVAAFLGGALSVGVSSSTTSAPVEVPEVSPSTGAPRWSGRLAAELDAATLRFLDRKGGVHEVDDTLPPGARPLLDPDPLDWDVVLGRLPVLQAYRDWVASGGLPHDLPVEELSALRTVDARFLSELGHRPLHPGVDLFPSTRPIPPPAPLARSMTNPTPAAGWRGAAYRSLAELLVATTRYQDQLEACIEGRCPQELDPAVLGRLGDKVLGGTGLRDRMRDLYRFESVRPALIRWLRPGQEAFRRWLYATARALEEGGDPADELVMATVKVLGENQGFLYHSEAHVGPEGLLGRGPKSPAGWFLRGMVMTLMGSARARAQRDDVVVLRGAAAAFTRALEPSGPSDLATRRFLLGLGHNLLPRLAADKRSADLLAVWRRYRGRVRELGDRALPVWAGLAVAVTEEEIDVPLDAEDLGEMVTRLETGLASVHFAWEETIRENLLPVLRRRLAGLTP